VTEELNAQNGRDMLEMVMKNHSFLCKRGIQARTNSFSDYFSRGLGVTPKASAVFKKRGGAVVNTSNTVA